MPRATASDRSRRHAAPQPVTRRRFLRGAAALVPAAALAAAGAAVAQPDAEADAVTDADTVTDGGKADGGKGVSVTAFDGAAEAIVGVGASWYCNWASTTGSTERPDGIDFVPMIWGGDAVNPTDLGNAEREGTQLLGFNEPDMPGQADMPVDRALELWPQLEATGLRLGAPAVAFGADQPGSWFDRFMTGAAERGLRTDFVPLHWYGADFGPAAVGHLRGYLEAVHERWGKPLWLTEYALTDFTGSAPRYPSEDEQIAFVRAVVPMLTSLPFLERHAWFTASSDVSPTGLWTDGAPNATGLAYRGA